MSRLVVKNLPKKITAENLKSTFSTKGEVTDISLKFTKAGAFRNFAFIGFKTEEQASAAKDYFHESFINSSKIKVEICQNLGSTEVKSWSKHSKNRKDVKSPNPKSLPGKNKKFLGSSENNLDKDPQFAEFLEVHRKRKDKPLWSNDGILPSKPHEDDSESGISDDDDDDDDDIEGSTKKENDDLKSKTVASNTSTKTSKTDKIEYTVKIRGIPKKADRKNIKAFFAPLKYTSLRIPGNVKGVAYVQFKNEVSLKKALIKNRGFMNGSRVTVTDFTKYPETDIPNKKENNEDKAKNLDALVETGRIFVRNLTYTCKEEDLEKVFKPFGPLTEVNLPIDNFTKNIKGFAFITFMLPEHAVKAFEQLDGTIFQGRTFHLIPANPAKQSEINENASFKEKKDQKIKEQSGSAHKWNTLFLGANAVADVMAEKYKTPKAKLLSSKNGESIAVRMALGETQIISDTKEFLTENGVDLQAFDVLNSERSKTVILVKNLPAKTSPSELMPIFNKFGDIKQILLPPSGITAIVEFQDANEAKKAFKNTAYKRFGSVPLYLEWAPVNIFDKSSLELTNKEKSKVTNKGKKLQVKNKLEILAAVGKDTILEELNEGEDEKIKLGSTLFVKNLNFDTIENELQSHFKSCGKIKNVTIARKKDLKNVGEMLSMGYGFIQFQTKKAAQKALKELQHSKLNGHALELKISNKATNAQVNVRKVTENKDMKTSKLLVRNIPFEASKKEVTELFRVFGELKSIRLPQKHTGSVAHRGFGFVDFVTRADAKRAMESVSQSTHLYGRRLVLEWAKTDDTDVDILRRKTADTFQPGLSKSKKLKQSIQEDL